MTATPTASPDRASTPLNGPSSEPATWTLVERLGVEWRDELVFLECEAARAPRALSDGTNQFPCQYDATRNALACVLTLPANATLTLHAVASASAATTATHIRPTAGASAGAGATSGDRVYVREVAGAWRMGNGQAEFHLHREPTVQDMGDAWEIDGPVIGWVGRDGVRRGGSRLRIAKARFLPHDVRSLTRVEPARMSQEIAEVPTVDVALLAAGAVFARYRYTVRLADGRSYEWTATIYRRQPILRIDEHCDTGREGAMTIEIARDFPADLYLTNGVEPGSPERQLPLPPHAFRLGSLAPHHSQTHIGYPWLGFMQSRRPQGSYRGIGEINVVPYSDVVVMMGDHPWDWDYAAECTYQFHTDVHGVVSASGAVRRGRRTWFLIVESRNHIEAPPVFRVGNESWTVSPLAVWHRRLNDLPLEWVRRCELEGGDAEQPEWPTAILTESEWKRKRRGIFPQLAPHLEMQAARSPFTRWVIGGETKAARTLFDNASATLEQRFQVAWASGFLANDVCPVMTRCLGPAAIDYQIAVSAGVTRPEERARLRRLLLLFAHATAGDALFPSHHNYLPPHHPRATRNWTLAENYSTLFGTPNFQTDVYYNLGLFGAVFPDHPQSRAWLDDAAQQMGDQLAAHFAPDGTYIESIGYFSHMFGNMLHLASVLRRQGARDFYAERRFQNAMLCFVDYQGAPRRRTLEHALKPELAPDPGVIERHLPAIGDTGTECVEIALPAHVLHAAWEVLEHAPKVADRLFAAWQAAGRRYSSQLTWYYGFCYVQALDHDAGPQRLAPRRFGNVGVMLRADVDQPGETSIFLRSGKATHHWGFDQGHFTLTTRGSQVVPDFGYFGNETTGGPRVMGFETWLHNIVTFGDWAHGGQGTELRRAERRVTLGEAFDYVVMDLSQSFGISGYWRNSFPVPPVIYERHFVFAHNRYVLVWDRIEHSTVRSQLRVAALAQSVAIDGTCLRFTGLDDVNLTVHLLHLDDGSAASATAAADLREGLVGPQRYVLCEQDCERDYLWLSQPLGPGEREFDVRRDGRSIRVAGTDLHGVAFVDHIAFATDDEGAEVSIDGVAWRLDGRFALHHQEGADSSAGRVALLEGERFAPIDG